MRYMKVYHLIPVASLIAAAAFGGELKVDINRDSKDQGNYTEIGYVKWSQGISGSTNDPERRLDQHNKGHVSATRNKGPWKRVALITFSSPTIARKAEHHLKRQKNRRATLQAIDGTYPWPSFEG